MVPKAKPKKAPMKSAKKKALKPGTGVTGPNGYPVYRNTEAAGSRRIFKSANGRYFVKATANFKRQSWATLKEARGKQYSDGLNR